MPGYSLRHGIEMRDCLPVLFQGKITLTESKMAWEMVRIYFETLLQERNGLPIPVLQILIETESVYRGLIPGINGKRFSELLFSFLIFLELYFYETEQIIERRLAVIE